MLSGRGAEVFGGTAGVAAEEGAEMTLVLETEGVGDLLDGLRGGSKERAGTMRECVVHVIHLLQLRVRQPDSGNRLLSFVHFGAILATKVLLFLTYASFSTFLTKNRTINALLQSGVAVPVIVREARKSTKSIFLPQNLHMSEKSCTFAAESCKS